MGDTPAVSVLMPAYNVRRYIEQAVRSILEQTFRDFELIIIDDGSTDGTTEILRRLASEDARIRLVSRPNTGYAIALNEALALSRASLLARMDSDDVALPERFERQVRYLAEHPECVLVGSQVMLIDPDGDPLFQMPSLELEHEKIEAQLLTAGWPLVHPVVMMRREAVIRAGAYRQDYVPVEDHELFVRLAEIGRLANLPETLLHYRRHPASAVNRFAANRARALNEIIEGAWTRRGITHREGFPKIQVGGSSALDQQKLWVWKSLGAGHVRTARKHAFRALRVEPFSRERWKALYCTIRGY